VATDVFSPEYSGKEEFKRNNGISNSTKLICYSGSMYENLWNNPDEYACTMKKLLQMDLDLKFMFLIPSDSNELLHDKLSEYGITKSDYLIKNPEFDQVPVLLSYADLGLYILDRSSIRIGTKFVEYCSTGLPTIVNQNVKGAAELIHENNLGREIFLTFNRNNTYCPDEALSEEDYNQIFNLISNKNKISMNCREFAKENFETSEVAKKYANIY
jgi:glycosyltransferase involved in cell wall biosynthesis